MILTIERLNSGKSKEILAWKVTPTLNKEFLIQFGHRPRYHQVIPHKNYLTNVTNFSVQYFTGIPLKEAASSRTDPKMFTTVKEKFTFN